VVRSETVSGFDSPLEQAEKKESPDNELNLQQKPGFAAGGSAL
jgi:hypothetical protein